MRPSTPTAPPGAPSGDEPPGEGNVRSAARLGWSLAELRGRYWWQGPRPAETSVPVDPPYALPLQNELTPAEARQDIAGVVVADATRLGVAHCDGAEVWFPGRLEAALAPIEVDRGQLLYAPDEPDAKSAERREYVWRNIAALLHEWDAAIRTELSQRSPTLADAYLLGRGLAESYWALGPGELEELGPPTPRSAEGLLASSGSFLFGSDRRRELSRLLGRLGAYLHPLTPAAVSGGLEAWGAVISDPQWRSAPSARSDLFRQVGRWYDLVVGARDPTTLLRPGPPLIGRWLRRRRLPLVDRVVVAAIKIPPHPSAGSGRAPVYRKTEQLALRVSRTRLASPPAGWAPGASAPVAEQQNAIAGTRWTLDPQLGRYVAVAAAGVVPVVATGLLLWAAASSPAPETLNVRALRVGVLAAWAAVVVLIAAVAWCVVPGVQRRARKHARLFRRDVVAPLLHEPPAVKIPALRSPQDVQGAPLPEEPTGLTRSRSLQREIVLARSQRLSVAALWPDVETVLTPDQRRSATSRRSVVDALRATAAGAATSGVALLLSPLVVRWAGSPFHRADYVYVALLAAAVLLLAAGSLLHRDAAAGRLTEWQVQMIKVHGATVAAAYGLLWPATDPHEQEDVLRTLSLTLIEGGAGIPSLDADPTRRTGPAVDEQIRRSLAALVRRPVAVDVEGSIRAWAIRLSEAKAEIRIEVRTGSRAYQEASDSAAARFGLSGGERAASAELEAVVDAPGLEVRPARHRDDVRTDNGHQTWRSIVSGDLLDAEVWVTLFAGNRYVQATKVGLEDAAVQP